MTKWREDRTYEIMTHLSKNAELRNLYDKEFQKSQSRYPRTEHFERMEKCYEKAKTKLNNENL
jgi:hypothetical protein